MNLNIVQGVKKQDNLRTKKTILIRNSIDKLE